MTKKEIVDKFEKLDREFKKWIAMAVTALVISTLSFLFIIYSFYL